MDEMTSGEFRKRYARLTEPVVVTVLGRPIGQWTPITSQEAPRKLSDLVALGIEGTTVEEAWARLPEEAKEYWRERGRDRELIETRVLSGPISTPVPKPGES